MRYKKEEITAVDKICFATTKLVLTNGYHDVNVSDIIKEADVSRSTFYVYFKNKEEIIIRICDHILDHVFSKHLFMEDDQDFSKYSEKDLKDIIIRSFKNFSDEGELVLSILDSGASSIFLKRLRKQLDQLIIAMIDRKIIGDNEVPKEIKIHQYIIGYTTLLQYFLRNKNKIKSETIADYYFELYK